jgi:hypothetical protein
VADAVEQFAGIAREYRAWVLTGTDRGPDAARRALELVGRLYLAALALPPQWCEDRDEVEPPPPSGWPEVYPALVARLPFQHYGEVFNPLLVPPEASLIGDLADDLTDIFAEVEAGLRWLGAGHPDEAVWEWGFGLVHHWGEHATSAVRALHCWLAAEHPELLAKPKPAEPSTAADPARPSGSECS